MRPRESIQAIWATFYEGTPTTLCSNRQVPGSSIPDSSRIRNADKGLPRTIERDFSNPNLAAPLAWLSNDTRIMVLPQVVAELWPFGESQGQTRGGAESLKISSCTAKWFKPLQFAYQMKALGTVRTSTGNATIPSEACALCIAIPSDNRFLAHCRPVAESSRTARV